MTTATPTRTRLYKVVTPLRTRLIEAGSRSSALLHAATTEILVSLPEQAEVHNLAKAGVEIEHAKGAQMSAEERAAETVRRAGEEMERSRLHGVLTSAMQKTPANIAGIVSTQNFKETYASVSKRLMGSPSLTSLQSMANSLVCYYPHIQDPQIQEAA